MIVIKVIPDRIFHILWDYTSKCDSEEEYIRYFTSIKSKGYIDFYKECEINEANIIETLSNIYTAGNLSVKEIIELSGKKKVDISHIFCIPIRTLEDWYAGKAKCNNYVRLMLIRYFDLLDLGKRVEPEYKNIQKKNKKIYNSNSVNSKNTKTNKISDDDMNVKVYKNKNIKQYDLDSYEEFIRKINQSQATARILQETDYLDDIIKKNKKNE